ncbi:hypothetical protein PHB09_165 [Pseudomonas phage PHB09]|uniref:Uncharacterized protein n=1 Tax=Pseudomonas phage PHB09 TaxID=2867265 RepID=A0AAE9BMS5_9CAUD|nr:hypothetical protein QGX10_gp164 [Pseudomonas phage PHB09]UAV84660.1 hypothetical protein PHB09_165 [Pseudomonas phage PHB09]
MTEVDRYNPDCTMWMCGASEDMVKDPEGKWVKVEAYIALEEQLERLLKEHSSDAELRKELYQKGYDDGYRDNTHW